MRRWIIRVVIGIVALLVVATGGFVWWWSTSAPVGAAALQSMQSGNGVTVVDTNEFLSFVPTGTPKAGFVFYPGARVAPAAYATIMHGIAEKGFAVFVLKVPLNMALLGTNRAADVIAANPTIKVWAVGGHSLGGAAASLYAADHKEVRGLIFYATYPATSLATRSDLAILSVYGSNDGLATSAKVEANKLLLPSNARYVEIKGGIHAYFGDYGPQDGDGKPDISRAEQAAQTVNASAALLEQISQ